jgi:hypothetical protein
MCGYCVREYIVAFFSRTCRRVVYHFNKRRRKRWYKHTHTPRLRQQGFTPVTKD